MKKQALAVAVAAAFSVPVSAQVTVSGTLDFAAHSSDKVTTNSTSNVSTTADTYGLAGRSTAVQGGWQTSEIIFSATEDLGGGLKATAVFSQNADGDTFAARRRYVDLAGSFGVLRFGKHTPDIGIQALSGVPSTTSAGSLNHFVAGSTEFFGSNTARAGSFERQDQVLQYSSPTFNGFKAVAGYKNAGLDNSDSDRGGDGKTRMEYLSLYYSAGPLSIGAGTASRKVNVEAAPATANACTVAIPALTSNSAQTITVSAAGCSTGVAAVTQRDSKADMDWVGATYNLGAATVYVAHGRREDSDATVGSAMAVTADQKVNSFGVMATLGSITFRGSLYEGKDERATGTTDDMKLSGHQVSAEYALSKRTSLYGIVGENKIERDSASNTTAERKRESVNFGVWHKF